MKLLACLLNWRTADMTLRALERLLDDIKLVPNARICVVDNDSQDGSFETLTAAARKRGWAELVDVVQSGHNGGFGYGNNVALRRGLFSDDPPDYFYLLNSDAFPDAGAVKRLVDHLDAHADVGVAGSFIHALDGKPQESCFRFPTVLGEVDRSARLGVIARLLRRRQIVMPVPDGTTSVDWVSGASMMVRRQVLDDIGLFDETFFLYYEETDLCLRARRAGWGIDYVRASSVAHIGGASTGVQSHTVVPKRMPEYVFASRRHYFLKNYGRATLWAANLANLVAGASFRLRRLLQRKDDPERPREWLDGVLYNVTHP